MHAGLFPIALTLFLIIDALGNIPAYYALIKKYDKKTQTKIAVREMIIALLIMFLFVFIGKYILAILGITKATVQISGSIILFLIAIRLIFSNEDEKLKWGEQKPFIVPIATPIIAGPSLLAAIMIFAQEACSNQTLLLAITIAWLASSILFFFAPSIFKVVKEKGLLACQRLMGLIVAIVAVQAFLTGLGGICKG